jgi:hypothetical protein
MLRMGILVYNRMVSRIDPMYPPPAGARTELDAVEAEVMELFDVPR